jgi:hypothetical protein
LSFAFYKGNKQRRKHDNFKILYFYSRAIPAQFFLAVPNFGTLIGNSWNVLERRVIEGTTFYYKQVGEKLQTRDFIPNKPFIDEVGYCLWMRLNVDFGEVGCSL